MFFVLSSAGARPPSATSQVSTTFISMLSVCVVRASRRRAAPRVNKPSWVPKHLQVAEEEDELCRSLEGLLEPQPGGDVGAHDSGHVAALIGQ